MGSFENPRRRDHAKGTTSIIYPVPSGDAGLHLAGIDLDACPRGRLARRSECICELCGSRCPDQEPAGAGAADLHGRVRGPQPRREVVGALPAHERERGRGRQPEEFPARLLGRGEPARVGMQGCGQDLVIGQPRPDDHASAPAAGPRRGGRREPAAREPARPPGSGVRAAHGRSRGTGPPKPKPHGAAPPRSRSAPERPEGPRPPPHAGPRPPQDRSGPPDRHVPARHRAGRSVAGSDRKKHRSPGPRTSTSGN